MTTVKPTSVENPSKYQPHFALIHTYIWHHTPNHRTSQIPRSPILPWISLLLQIHFSHCPASARIGSLAELGDTISGEEPANRGRLSEASPRRRIPLLSLCVHVFPHPSPLDYKLPFPSSPSPTGALFFHADLSPFFVSIWAPRAHLWLRSVRYCCSEKRNRCAKFYCSFFRALPENCLFFFARENIKMKNKIKMTISFSSLCICSNRKYQAFEDLAVWWVWNSEFFPNLYETFHNAKRDLKNNFKILFRSF